MNSAILEHITIAEGQIKLQDKIQVSDRTTSEPIYTKAYLFYQLTESDHIGKGMELDQITSAYRTGELEIYINGVHYPFVTDYMGIRSLTLALRGISSHTFKVKEQVNEEGQIVRLYYIGQ